MFYLMIIAVFLLLLLVAFKPKWGTLIIWPVLFTYPHGWWYYRNFLPLNIGVDDLFCVALFVIVLVRRNMFGGIRPRFGYAFWVVTAFTLIAAIANLVRFILCSPSRNTVKP